jgi:hypothetical protein
VSERRPPVQDPAYWAVGLGRFNNPSGRLNLVGRAASVSVFGIRYSVFGKREQRISSELTEYKGLVRFPNSVTVEQLPGGSRGKITCDPSGSRRSKTTVLTAPLTRRPLLTILDQPNIRIRIDELSR